MRLPNEGDHSLTVVQLANYVDRKQTLYLKVSYETEPGQPIDAQEIEVMGIFHNPVAKADR